MIVVVGGGIAGIVSAILLQKKFGQVCIIERNDRIGGLYRSKRCDLGVTFDYGSHFLRPIGHPELDNILFGRVDEKHWRVVGNLKGGAFYGSKLNAESHFLDARQLPKNIYQQGIIELLNIMDDSPKPLNLEDQLVSFFGQTFTDHIFRPIISDKYFGCNLDELSIDAHGLLGLNRILGFTPEATREIKQSALYDQKFAFHSSIEGASKHKNYYPINDGIELWIDLLKAKLNALNIQIISGVQVKQILHDKGLIESIKLDNGETVKCKSIFWTIAPSLFLKLCNLPVKKPSVPLQKLHTSLFHFVFDKPFLTDVYYVHCHDPGLKTFRITLYPNIQRNGKDIFHLTSEVIAPHPPDLKELEKQVLFELVHMGIVSKEAGLLFRDAEILSNGFPFPSPRLKTDSDYQIEVAKGKIQNVSFLGRASGGDFTMGPVLFDVYQTIEQLPQTIFSR